MTLDRREFLRLGVAGALAGGVSLLVLAPRGEACEVPVACGACGRFTGCELPKAEQAREAKSQARGQINGGASGGDRA